MNGWEAVGYGVTCFLFGMMLMSMLDSRIYGRKK